MHAIDTKIFSHSSRSLIDKKYNKDIVTSYGSVISSYNELVEEVAKIGFYNSSHNLFFRGQEKDYKVDYSKKGPKKSSIYPKIFRNDWLGKRRISKAAREKIFRELSCACDLVVQNWNFSGSDRMSRYKELQWAIIQHYGIYPTPLVDVTQSLRVAASFATMNNDARYGYLYAFGLPNINGSISYFTDYDLVLVKLQSICPPEALRAHFQEGFLVGHFPEDRIRKSNRNLAGRMIAKYRIEVDGFWGGDFPSIPENVLKPPNDEMSRWAERIKNKID